MVDENSPVYIGTNKPVIRPNKQISKGDGYNSFLVTIENHCGTHTDAPRHFLPDGKIISDYHLDELIFTNPLILDCPKFPGELIEIKDISTVDLEGIDCLFFHTGFGKCRKDHKKTYLAQNPGISPDTIYWLRENFKSIKCIGIDCISISSYQNEELGKKAHLNAFMKQDDLGDPLILIEDMNLGIISKEDVLEEVIVLPWQIRGIDSAPCIVLGKIK